MDVPLVIHLTRSDITKGLLLMLLRTRTGAVMLLLVGLPTAAIPVLSFGIPTDWVRATVYLLITAVATTGIFAAAVAAAIGTAIFFPGSGVVGEHVYTFQAEGFRERTAVNDTLHLWDGVSRTARGWGVILLFISPVQAHMLPRRSFGSAQEWEELWSEIQRLHETCQHSRSRGD